MAKGSKENGKGKQKKLRREVKKMGKGNKKKMVKGSKENSKGKQKKLRREV